MSFFLGSDGRRGADHVRWRRRRWRRDWAQTRQEFLLYLHLFLLLLHLNYPTIHHRSRLRFLQCTFITQAMIPPDMLTGQFLITEPHRRRGLVPASRIPLGREPNSSCSGFPPGDYPLDLLVSHKGFQSRPGVALQDQELVLILSQLASFNI